MVIGKPDGNQLALTEAISGKPAGTGTEAELDRVRVNNRLRGVIEARGGLAHADEPRSPGCGAVRPTSLFKRPDPAALAALDAAIAAEKDAAHQDAPSRRRAPPSCWPPTPPSSRSSRPSTSCATRATAMRWASCRPPSTAPPIPRSRPRPTAAAASVRQSLAAWEAAQNVWYGISLGSVLLLAAIGLAITFGTMGVINMAHGEMVMLGAYTTFVVQDIIRTSSPHLFDASLVIALPLAFLVAGASASLIERGIIRFLYGRPLDTLLATWGLSLVLQQAVRSIFGPSNREVGAPSWMSGAFQLGQLTITYGRLWIVVFSLMVFAALILLLRKTPLGLYMRAVTQNRPMASAMGIRTPRVDALTFGLGSGIAGLAGVALSQIDNVSPNLGQGYIIDSFMVVVFGGVGNLFGTLVGATALGIVNKFLEPYAGAVLGKILVLVFIILFIQRRPRGLFALKGRSVE